MTTNSVIEHKPFPKIMRYEKSTCRITEKLDGTNAVLYKSGNTLLVGSRNQWLSEDNDNHGFYKFVQENKDALLEILHNGYYYGEFIGAGIQRRYDLDEKHLYLFNTKLNTELSDVIHTVPVLAVCALDVLEFTIECHIDALKCNGSNINGYNRPEGLIARINHTYNLKVIIDK